MVLYSGCYKEFETKRDGVVPAYKTSSVSSSSLKNIA